ncbi:hypothetical protein BXZ70DRAFT_1011431 [Cristinia sonorae]|uniref:Fe2OG dioxygenase domain-containing protein n=1 Tax=Cristinia sonorae TaxID=1940300 RepID=A0A8K0XLA5_9AGAR|nr:hypothetical protein BXZ70DRAFT_1011431 [Cristinia sonorae]
MQSIPALQAMIEPLRNAFTAGIPYISGTLCASSDDLGLFYNTEKETRFLHFSTATVEDLDLLEKACDAATFGRNDQNVLDETYRKAGKLDASNFASGFDIHVSGLPELIANKLLDGQGNMRVRAERYKLNVYGKDAFFKAHKDTPRSEDMFGSLVLIFPTEHAGGSLVLRDASRTWTFDSAKALQDHSKTSSDSIPGIAYIAFYSDIEHEVTKVESGHRVTVTYNLYQVPCDPSSVSSGVTEKSEMKEILSGLLNDSNFLPGGGYLGFGLQHEYPLGRLGTECHRKVYLQRYRDLLKGPDAELMRAASQLSLDATLNLRYLYDNDHPKSTNVLCNFIPPESDKEIEDDYTIYLQYELDAPEISSRMLYDPEEKQHPWEAEWEERNGQEYLPNESKFWVNWVTPVANNKHRTTFMAYGNEPVLTHEYGQLCLVIQVGPFGKRQTASM